MGEGLMHLTDYLTGKANQAFLDSIWRSHVICCIFAALPTVKVRAVVIQGNQRSFSTGRDLKVGRMRRAFRSYNRWPY